MEVCGGQTHSIIRNGIDQILPPELAMIHGPGCPVCVTPLEVIDKALAIAKRPGIIFCSFGDMLRVPGSNGDLFQVRGAGGDVRVIYSPLDAVKIAKANPDHEVVFLAIMSVREGLEFDADIESDSAPLHEMVAAMLDACPDIHVLRDPTRGGLAASLNEIAVASQQGIIIEEHKLPVNPTVQGACEFLGLDHMLVANEGKLICIAPRKFASVIIDAMKSNEFGSNAALIGTVVDGYPGMVIAKTSMGGSRVVPISIGEHLPRIC